MSMAERRYVCQFLCHGVEHTLVLPRRSPLGTFDDPQNQPKGKWPITFLCLLHRHVCEVTLDTIRPDIVQTVPLGLNAVSLWQIEYECDRQNCGQHQTIYTRYLTDAEPQTLIETLQDACPLIFCERGHPVGLRKDLITVERLD